MEQVIQIAGALLILAAFVAAQARRLETSATTYLVLNLVGSATLTWDAAVGHAWGFLLLEGIWAVVSLWALISKARGRTTSAAH